MKDLKTGRTLILPESDHSFDPSRIPKAIEDAGFSAPRVEVVVEGTVEQRAGSLVLRVPGLDRPFVLKGGGKLAELESRADVPGARIRLTGRLRLPEAGGPPELSVEYFE